MAYDFFAHPDAAIEMDSAFAYYGEFSLQVLSHFADELEKRIDRILEHPSGGHPCHERYRRMNLKGFQHALIYRLKGESIYVIAFIHEKQRPLYWLHRITDDND